MVNQLQKLAVFGSLSKAAVEKISAYTSAVNYPKGFVLIHADKIESNFYILESGIARAYSDGENQQITFWFGQSGSILFSFNSYINNKSGYENIELLENSILYELKTDSLIQSYNSHTELANWGRKLAELELIKTEERYIARLFKSASARYKELQASYPALINRIQLGHIASYLGVTQVTLSRIRSENK